MEGPIIILLVAAFLIWSFISSRKQPPKTHSAPATRNRDRVTPTQNRSVKLDDDSSEVRGTAYVVDGDTLTIRGTQVRLFGIDAPELDHPHGQKAKWALLSLCKGEVVRGEITAQDVHGRTVARCYLNDGRDLSAEMVKLGLAIDWPKFSGGEYAGLEVPGVRKKLWLADARQKGRMHVWEQYSAQKNAGRAHQ